MRSLVLGIVLCGAATMLSLAAASDSPALAPAEALDFVRLGDLHFSPDGSQLALVALSYRWDWRPHVRIVDVETGRTRELTPAGKSERSPQWSPDGKTLAYLSNRGGETEVYAMPASGGAAKALTQRKNGVDGFRWSPEGKTIAYIAKDDTAPATDNGPQLADDPRQRSHLWLVDLASGITRDLPTGGLRIDEVEWRSSAQLLFLATDKPAVEEYTDAIYAMPIRRGALALVARPPQPCEELTVSPNGRAFAIRATRASGPIARDLFLGTVGGGDIGGVAALPDLAVAEMRWHEPSAIWLRMLDGFYSRIWKYSQDGRAERIDLPLSVDTFDIARNDEMAFVGEDFRHLPELYVRTADGRIRRLGEMQNLGNRIRLAPVETFKATSFDGTSIEAALMKPLAMRPRSKLPLVLLVHGGPSSNFAAGYGWWTAWAEMLASHGYAVLMVNPRGSNGYSEQFLKANRGDWGGGDYRDLIAVLDAVIARGGIDTDRLGIGGWSYGGEMSEWAITQSNRFKAAVAGAGVFDQQAEFETEDDPAGDEWYFGTPWEHRELFARNSPSTFIRNGRTPTLIVDGEEDQNNPVGQSKGLYRALKHFGVETQMVLYPGEGHSPKSRAYNIDMFQRFLGWYDRHLHPRGDP